MNTLLRILSIFPAVIAWFPWAAAQDVPAGPRLAEPTVRVQLEFIEISQTLCTRLMAGPRSSANDGPLRQQVAELIAQGKATISETLVGSAPSGNRISVRSVTGFVYPTEYQPAAVSGTFLGTEPGITPSSPPTYLVEVGPQDEYLGPEPSRWDTRNLGSTLETEPQVSAEGNTIDVNCDAGIVCHVGDWIWTEWVGPHGTSHIRMPIFHTLRCRFSTVVLPNEYQLAAALTPKNEAGVNDPTRKVMVFVKCGISQ